MHIGLGSPPADNEWPLVADLGVEYIKLGVKLENMTVPQLRGIAELHAEHGCQTIVDLRVNPPSMQTIYQELHREATAETCELLRESLGLGEHDWPGTTELREALIRLAEATGQPKILTNTVGREAKDTWLRTMDAFGEKVHALVEGCADLITEWEVQGEFTCPIVMQGPFLSLDYSLHLSAFSDAIRQANPAARVWTGGSGVKLNVNWLRALLGIMTDATGEAWFPEGLGRAFDVCNWHPYGHTCKDFSIKLTLEQQVEDYEVAFTEARGILAEHGQDQPFASTEWGLPFYTKDMIPGAEDGKLVSFQDWLLGGVWAVPEEASGEWYEACLGSFVKHGFEIVCLHSLRDMPGIDYQNRFWGSYCGMTDFDYKRRPAFDVAQRFAWEGRNS